MLYFLIGEFRGGRRLILSPTVTGQLKCSADIGYHPPHSQIQKI
jgi:hypothetical protein